MSAKSGVLALAGPPAAGKSTLARHIAQQTGARNIAFGDYVRANAAAMGLDTNRETLQRLGQALLEASGAEAFCCHVLRSAGGTPTDRPVIWDGVRHVAVLDALSALYGPELRLVYLDPPIGVRLNRLGILQHELAVIDQDATEAERERIRERSDLVCDEPELDHLSRRVMTLLGLAGCS